MTPLLLTDQDVNGLLTMEEAIDVVEGSLRHQAQGEATNRAREHVMGGPGVYLATMQAADYRLGVVGFKTYAVTPGHHRFFVYLYDADDGGLLSIIEANRLGQLRTGAATAVVTRYMARQDAVTVGILGSGFQARTQLEGVCKVRPVAAVRVYSPTPAHRRAYADEMSDYLGIEIEPVGSARLAVEGADVLVTITSSSAPVFDGEWLSPGAHVNAVGGAHPYMRELDDRTIGRADVVVVDDVAQARIEAGELMMPASRGLLLWEQVRELWQVVSGVAPGRRGAEDITLFKSLGMALWDVAAAKAVYDKAIVQGIGHELGS